MERFGLDRAIAEAICSKKVDTKEAREEVGRVREAEELTICGRSS